MIYIHLHKNSNELDWSFFKNLFNRQHSTPKVVTSSLIIYIRGVY